MKPLVISFVFFIVSFILFSNCSKDSNAIVTPTEKNENVALEKKKNKWPAVIYDSTYGEIVMDYSVIVPMAGTCGEKQTYGWGFDHYEPKQGKILGLWANHNTGQQEWTEYRTRWGFTQQLFESTAYGELGGYSKANCLVPIPNFSTYQSAILNSDSCNYYVDEPFEQERFSMAQLLEVAYFLNTYRPYSLLYISSYSPPSWVYDYVLDHTNNTLIMYDKYEGDQRSMWSTFRNHYGTLNPANWIHTNTDLYEFSQLIGHATNLGINTLWFFIGNSGGHPSNVPSFSDAAWRSGWLRKFEQYFRIEWHCDYGCDCDPSDPDVWYVYKVWLTGGFREVYP